MKFYILLIGIFSFSSWAQTSDKCNFEVKCEHFNLTFKSTSGECEEDDTKINFLLQPKGTPQPLNIQPAWYYETANIGNVQSKCSSTNYSSYPAYDIGTSKLIFLRKNGRPGHDKIQALLLNPKDGKVIDALEIGSYLRNTLGILKTKNGFKLQIIKGSLKEMNCDCDAALIEGWMEISVKKGKLQKKWL